MLQIISFPSQIRTNEMLTISGRAIGHEGLPLTLTIDNQYQAGAGIVPVTGEWSVRFRFTHAGSRQLVFSLKTSQGTVIKSQPITISVVDIPVIVAPPPSPVTVTSFPATVQTRQAFVLAGMAKGYEGKALSLVFDNGLTTPGGAVASDGSWQITFQFLQPGRRSLAIAVDQGPRSQMITIEVTEAPSSTVQIVSIPSRVNVREVFTIRGTATNALGQTVTLTFENQLTTNAGPVAPDGTWSVQFQFLQPGTRRITASIEGLTGGMSETVTIAVTAMTSRLTITPPSQPLRAKEVFTLSGMARDFENGDQLVVRVDRQYVVARPIVQNQQWQARIFLSQGGMRLFEVIASEQEQTQLELTVVTSETPTTASLDLFPYTVWTSLPTPNDIPDLVNPRRITLHHTVIAALQSNATQADEIQRMRRILAIHLDRGYSDIGYHYIIMPSGRVYEGRSSLKRGAHDVINDGFGVAVDGDFQNLTRIGARQFDTIVALCTMLCRRVGITDPITPVSTLVDGGGVRQLPRILGHQDRVATGCPGTIYQRLGEIRESVRQALRS